MNISKFFKQYYLIFCALFFLSISLFISNQITRPIVFVSRQDSSINLNNQLISFFHLGQKRLISSLLWVSTILESDHQHYKNHDLNSWMFLRFKTMSDLEPKFYENYIFGGTYLSIIKDDLEGASFLYNKALLEYPNDFDLLKNAAFHFYFEVGDLKTAYPIYRALKTHPNATLGMTNALARIEGLHGNLEIAFQLLKDQLDKIPDQSSFFAVKIKENLYSLKAEMDLSCLNEHRENCNFFDFYGEKYLLNNSTYSAQTKWAPFRPRGKKFHP